MVPVQERLRSPIYLAIVRALQQAVRDWKLRQVCLQGGACLGM